MAEEPIREMRLDVRPGLYALRYVSSSDVRSAPLASVKPIVGSAHAIQVISIPGLIPGELPAPGSSVVIVAAAPGAVEISLTALRGFQNLDARFSLDLLGSTETQRAVPVAQNPEATVDPRAAQASGRTEVSLEVVAHVSRRGDIKADVDGWIAGPRAPSSIEALQIKPLGCDLGIAAQFRNLESRAAWSAWLTPGAVIGVPKRACALTGVRLKLVGPDANRYELAGEGLFLGTPKISAKGSEIEFVAPGELDPLVGLKLALVQAMAPQTASSQDKMSRVRVFR